MKMNAKNFDEKLDYFGILPSFDLNCRENVIAWDSIRRFLLKYDDERFKLEQRNISFVFVYTIFAAVEVLCFLLCLRRPREGLPSYDPDSIL